MAMFRCGGKSMPKSVTFTNTLYGNGSSGYTNSWTFSYNSTIYFPTLGYKYADLSLSGMEEGDCYKRCTSSSIAVGENNDISNLETIDLVISGVKRTDMGKQPGTCSYTLTLHN